MGVVLIARQVKPKKISGTEGRVSGPSQGWGGHRAKIEREGRARQEDSSAPV